MSTDIRNLPSFLSGDADFRTWGSGVAAQLVTTGLVQTADTGQINWTTVTRPAVAATYAGYEIWRFADSLQATKPVFIKIEYGVAGAVDRPSLRIQICTATNGAGVPGGQLGFQRQMQPTVSKTAGATLPSYCSGTISRLTLFTHVDASSNGFGMLVLIERTKTAAGVETGDGIISLTTVGATTNYQVMPFAGSVPSSTTANGALSFAGSINSVGADVALSPTTAFVGKPFYALWCAYAQNDIGEFVSFQMTHLGAVHTFLPIGDAISATVAVGGPSGGATASIAMPWE